MSGTKEDNYELGYTGSAYEGAIVNGRMEGSAKCYSFASGTKYEVGWIDGILIDNKISTQDFFRIFAPLEVLLSSTRY